MAAIETRVVEKAMFRLAQPSDPIIASVIGENKIGLNELREYVELHFFDRDTNRLVKSVSTPLSEGFLYIRDSQSRRHGAMAQAVGKGTETIQFGLEFWNPENSANLYTKYLRDIPPGFYNVIVNFFAAEIGDYSEDKTWRLARISESKRELILEPAGSKNVDLVELGQFADKSIFYTDFKPRMEKLFDRDLDEENQYENIINLFFEILKKSDEHTYNHIFTEYSETHQLRVRKTLKNILANVYGDFMGSLRVPPDGTVVEKNWIDNEADRKRFRITDKNFEKGLMDSLYRNISANLSDFEDDEVFLNR